MWTATDELMNLSHEMKLNVHWLDQTSRKGQCPPELPNQFMTHYAITVTRSRAPGFYSGPEPTSHRGPLQATVYVVTICRMRWYRLQINWDCAKIIHPSSIYSFNFAVQVTGPQNHRATGPLWADMRSRKLQQMLSRLHGNYRLTVLCCFSIEIRQCMWHHPSWVAGLRAWLLQATKSVLHWARFVSVSQLMPAEVSRSRN
jgi:hypothetical protein